MATQETRPIDVRALVDADNGRISRRVYVEREIYERELERVFARGWLYLAHTSQLKAPGDYVTTFMGEDPVIVSRGADGTIRAFLNACRHRGMRVCRADEGNTSFFRCPYHSWTYANDGQLTGVPRYREAYKGVLDKSEWGLKEVAQLAMHQGLIFATWDADAPSLSDYLGPYKTILDLTFGRDPEGIEIIGGAHKWTIECNWKHPVENFAADMYHVSSAHQRPADLGLMGQIESTGYELATGMGYVGHQLTGPVSGDEASEDALHSYWTLPNVNTYILKEQRARIADELGPDLARLIPLGHSAAFPNFSSLDIEMLRLIRVQHPRGPGLTMIHQFCAVDASLDADTKNELRKQYELSFGPAGLLEQDDGENWRECQVGMSGYIGRNLEHNMLLGLGQERASSEFLGADVPGTAGGIWSEHCQRQFYRHWTSFMTSESWDELGAQLEGTT
ncbi:3-phenylpropionate/cinnamic acid dioxygenase subunit alpha [Paraconexibacter sp. AEG42_29]|uniref:3-phenylpropionate/cinnamic acid dioxygenase subunit alpha n=1 Tax=Paraconexibacter sp. AEG42_29 TaxID=2997339 RepID=A0AAU7B0L7_9ACTN